MKIMTKVLSLILFFTLVSCDAHSKIKDAIDLASSPSRKEIDTTRMGVNAFANDLRFGTIRSQYREVRDTLKLNHVRILFNWDDNVQPTPSSPLNFSFYDDLVNALPAGVDALVVLTAIPSWMSDPANWIDGNPRRTFVERWVKPVTRRYAGSARISSWQIWNEPNMLVNPHNHVLDIAENPENYVEMLAMAHNVAKQAAPGKLVVNAATTAINQNYPHSKNYNRVMRESGAEQFLDVWAIHYYGRQYENVVRSRGIRDFASELIRPIWITESGAQGPNSQLGYVEEVWPFLRDEIPGIDRIYYYQFTDAAPLEQNYGLRTLDSSFPVSDLYIYLRDR